MILTIISLALIFLSFLIYKLDDECVFDFVWLSTGVLGFIATAVCAIIIIASHCAIDNQIAQNKIKYDSLVARQSICASEYEDFSKSDTVRDISEWNTMVVSDKYWCNNPWTSWFYSKEVVNNLQTIDTSRD